MGAIILFRAQTPSPIYSIIEAPDGRHGDCLTGLDYRSWARVPAQWWTGGQFQSCPPVNAEAGSAHPPLQEHDHVYFENNL